jgi:hypothetical protein
MFADLVGDPAGSAGFKSLMNYRLLRNVHRDHLRVIVGPAHTPAEDAISQNHTGSEDWRPKFERYRRTQRTQMKIYGYLCRGPNAETTPLRVSSQIHKAVSLASNGFSFRAKYIQALDKWRSPDTSPLCSEHLERPNGSLSSTANVP